MKEEYVEALFFQFAHCENCKGALEMCECSIQNPMLSYKEFIDLMKEYKGE